jgi:hypothetical protein
VLTPDPRRAVQTIFQQTWVFVHCSWRSVQIIVTLVVTPCSLWGICCRHLQKTQQECASLKVLTSSKIMRYSYPRKNTYWIYTVLVVGLYGVTITTRYIYVYIYVCIYADEYPWHIARGESVVLVTSHPMLYIGTVKVDDIYISLRILFRILMTKHIVTGTLLSETISKAIQYSQYTTERHKHVGTVNVLRKQTPVQLSSWAVFMKFLGSQPFLFHGRASYLHLFVQSTTIKSTHHTTEPATVKKFGVSVIYFLES